MVILMLVYTNVFMFIQFLYIIYDYTSFTVMLCTQNKYPYRMYIYKSVAQSVSQSVSQSVI